MSENLIIFNAKVVTPLGFSARKGKEMAELRILEKATVEVVDGIITYVGPNRGEVRDGYYHHFCRCFVMLQFCFAFLQMNMSGNLQKANE